MIAPRTAWVHAWSSDCDGGQNPTDRQGVPPMRSRSAEGEPDQLVLVPDLGDQYPRLGLLGQQPDVEPGRPVGDKVGHFGEFGVG